MKVHLWVQLGGIALSGFGRCHLLGSQKWNTFGFGGFFQWFSLGFRSLLNGCFSISRPEGFVCRVIGWRA